jgi:fructokinase
LLAELTARQLSTDMVQHDSGHSTGTVSVRFDTGQTNYTFTDEVAWDYLEFTPEWRQLASECSAVCFGTLAQRSPQSRHTIGQFLDVASQAVRLFDINLRVSFFDSRILEEGCRRATMVKLNELELPILAEALFLPAGAPVFQLAQLRARYELDLVVYTRGRRGTMLVLPDKVISPPAVAYPVAEAADDVGAGDACSAAVLVGWLMQMHPTRIAALANHMGAYVASQSGATPQLPQEFIQLVQE